MEMSLLDSGPPAQLGGDELMGSNLQKLIEGADSDDQMNAITHALRYHGLHVGG